MAKGERPETGDRRPETGKVEDGKCARLQRYAQHCGQDLRFANEEWEKPETGKAERLGDWVKRWVNCGA